MGVVTLIETICGWCWRGKIVLWHLCASGNDFSNILYLRAGLLEEVTGQYLTIFSAFLFHVTLTICWYNCLEWSIKWRYIIKELFLSSDKNIQSCAVAISFQYLNFTFSEFKSSRKKSERGAVVNFILDLTISFSWKPSLICPESKLFNHN